MATMRQAAGPKIGCGIRIGFCNKTKKQGRRAGVISTDPD
jgi:hypothetical protein